MAPSLSRRCILTQTIKRRSARAAVVFTMACAALVAGASHASAGVKYVDSNGCVATLQNYTSTDYAKTVANGQCGYHITWHVTEAGFTSNYARGYWNTYTNNLAQLDYSYHRLYLGSAQVTYYVNG